MADGSDPVIAALSAGSSPAGSSTALPGTGGDPVIAALSASTQRGVGALPGGLYGYTDPTTGNPTFSRNAPPIGAQPLSAAGSPTAGQDNFTAGVGKSLVDTGRGAYQLGASIAHAAGLISDERMAQIQQGIDRAHELDQPLMQTTGGKFGEMVGQGAQIAALGPQGIVSGALAGGALGGLQPVQSGASREENAAGGAIGGAVGGAAGKVLGGIFGGFGTPEARAAAVATLDQEGIPLTVAQRTGSKLAQTVERTSAMTSDEPAEFAAQQAGAINRAVLRRVGVTDPNVTAATPDVIGPAKAAITNTMDEVAARTQPRVDDIFLNGLADAEQSAARQLPASDLAPIKQNLSDILQNASENGGRLDGTFVQKLNSNLGALSRNPAVAPIVSDIQDVVNDAVHRYAAPGDADLLSTARQQYRALKQIEPAIDPSTGNISVPKLMNSVNSKAFGGRNQTLYGQGDQSLIDLARAAKQIIPDTLGNSGTPERMLQPLGAMETLASGHPGVAAVKLLAGRAGLNAAGRAMRSQGATGDYLSEGAPGGEAGAFLSRRLGVPTGFASLSTILGAQQ